MIADVFYNATTKQRINELKIRRKWMQKSLLN